MANKPKIELNGELKQIQMGLGEAILRLIEVELSYRQRFAASNERALEERKMIIHALNQYDLNLGFDCDGDGIPDDVQIFQKATETSCCRILPHNTSRRPMSAARARAVKKSNPEAETVPTETPVEVEKPVEDNAPPATTKRSSRRT